MLVGALLTSILEFPSHTPLTFPDLLSVSTRTFPNWKRPFAIPPHLAPTPSLRRHAAYPRPFVPALSGSELKRAFSIILVHLCRFEIYRTGSCSFGFPCSFHARAQVKTRPSRTHPHVPSFCTRHAGLQLNPTWRSKDTSPNSNIGFQLTRTRHTAQPLLNRSIRATLTAC